MTSLAFESSLLDAHLEAARSDVPFAHLRTLPTVDRLMGGIKGKSSVIIGGEPGSGKTTLALQMAVDLASQGVPVVFAEAELDASQLLVKAVAQVSGGDLEVPEVTSLPADSPRLAECLEAFSLDVAPNLAFVTDARSPVELGALVSECARGFRTPPVLFVDYLQILDGDRTKTYHEERLSIRDTVVGLRSIANAHGAQVVSISTINRSSYSKENVGLDALGGCSYIEYSSDLILYLGLDGRGEQRAANLASPLRPVTLTALKNRRGLTGSVPLYFDTSHALFRER